MKYTDNHLRRATFLLSVTIMNTGFANDLKLAMLTSGRFHTALSQREMLPGISTEPSPRLI